MPSKYFLTLFSLTLYFKTLVSLPNSSFSFKNFGQDSTFNSVLDLYGDAKVSVSTDSLSFSTGRVIYKKPIKFYEGNPKKLVSFSTYFSFSIHSGPGSGYGNGDGDGLAFVVFSDGYPVDLFDDNGSFGLSGKFGNFGKFKFLSVEFDTSMDDKYNDVNGNHVGIDLNGFVSLKVRNLSEVDIGLDRGTRLQVWIDYESMSRRLEVRLSKFGENRPVDPVLFEHIDLPKIWPGNEGFWFGLSSFSRNSSQVCNVYSWSFKTRRAPDWMHSEPLDPLLLKEGEQNEVTVHKRSDCVMRILSALILGIGLGALGTFVGMFVWTIFGKRQPISPEDYAVKPVVVVHDKASANEKQ